MTEDKLLDMVLLVGSCSDLLQMLVLVLQTTEVGDEVLEILLIL